MKTIKIISVLLIILGFASINADSQKPYKDVITGNAAIASHCMDQWLVGSITIEYIYMNNHTQIRYYGTMTGSVDGIDYYVDGITNKHWGEYKGKEAAVSKTIPVTFHIYKDSKLYLITHLVSHHTVNANGITTVLRWYEEENCMFVGEGKIK